MAKKNSDEIRFQIDQLRKDRMIFTLESVAVSMVALLILFALISGAFQLLLGDLELGPDLAEKVLKVAMGVPFLYWVYAVISNILRLRKIKQLEKML